MQFSSYQIINHSVVTDYKCRYICNHCPGAVATLPISSQQQGPSFESSGLLGPSYVGFVVANIVSFCAAVSNDDDAVSNLFVLVPVEYIMFYVLFINFPNVLSIPAA